MRSIVRGRTVLPHSTLRRARSVTWARSASCPCEKPCSVRSWRTVCAICIVCAGYMARVNEPFAEGVVEVRSKRGDRVWRPRPPFPVKSTRRRGSKSMAGLVKRWLMRAVPALNGVSPLPPRTGRENTGWR
jgi:hypothetical protein